MLQAKKFKAFKSLLSDWVLVRTKSGAENWARDNCNQQEMETWLPRCKMPGKAKLQPVFPGYLFVRPGDKWRALRNTFGVIDILMRHESPEFVPLCVMRELRKREDAEGIITLSGQRPPVKGERVQIKMGSFQNHFAVYIGDTPAGRVRTLLEFMGNSVELELRRHWIETLD